MSATPPADLPNSDQKNIVLPSAEELEFKRRNLPDKPGVYLYKDSTGKVIYVGKAKSLKKRVNSYWKEHHSEDPLYADKIRRLVALIRDLDVFVVENESEALLLENELIKKYRPHFNAMLKDDKSFPWVMITREKFPRIKIIRGPERYGLQNQFIGPYVEITDVRHTLAQLRKIFPFCTCKRCVETVKRANPCIYYQIKLCPGPCVGKISPEAYQENIHHIEQVLKGETEEIERIFDQRMRAAAAAMEYEQAALWRNRMQALHAFHTNQSIFSYEWMVGEERGAEQLPPQSDERSSLEKSYLGVHSVDVVAGHTTKQRAGLIIIHVRQGKLMGKTPYIINLFEKLSPQDDFFLDLLQQHYLRPDIPLPDTIITESPIPDSIRSALTDFFQTGHPLHKATVQFGQPTATDKTPGLMRIAKKNIELLISQKEDYEVYLQEQKSSQALIADRKDALEILQDVLGLEEPPLIIEAFDMSNTQGTDPVGSMVTFVEGVPSKSHYRKFKIRSKSAPDDVGMMRESMGRRYKRAIEEDQDLPDLIVVDGGKGQLNMAHQLLEELNLLHIPHIGLAKREEEIFVPEQADPIVLPKDSSALHLLQALRDEAHRFAITYHRKLREKRQTVSELDDIPGIGPAKKKKLLQIFGSVDEIKHTPEEKLAEEVGPALAHQIVEFFAERARVNQSKRRVKKTKKSAIQSHNSDTDDTQKSEPPDGSE
jgi:excinuclease ABC subunit C